MQELPYKRTDRVGQQIREILGQIALKHIDLSHLGFITFTGINVSPDLRNAKIFYSVLNPKYSKDELQAAMNDLRKAFRKYIGPELKIKNIPKLKFYLDESQEYSEKVDKLLKDLKNIT
ncbi:MAG: 30S ribosome-binding factor RbfA [Candidatus Marinimicrobia bacterium]|jgi:ribosome-binding factor A|nr:30S ribosome-binding factor RbfA [Candidatus Neomarinimicrobiota bacterium]